MQNIFDFSEDEIKMILQQQFLEGKMKLEIEKAGATDPLTMMGVNPEIEQSQMDMMNAEMEAQGAMMGGQEEAPQSKYVDEKGNPLPDRAPDGKAYINAETGEAVNETISALMNTIVLKKNERIKSRPLNENTLRYDSTMKMLNRMSKKLDDPKRKNLNEIYLKDK